MSLSKPELTDLFHSPNVDDVFHRPGESTCGLRIVKIPDCLTRSVEYRGTSLIRNCPPPRTAIGTYAYAYCRVLGGGVF